MDSSLRPTSRRQEDYYDDDDDDEDYEEEEEDEEETGESSPAGSFDMELHSMTAKVPYTHISLQRLLTWLLNCIVYIALQGIKHLCSELLEINKASQEDFQRKVHLTYLSFLRYLNHHLLYMRFIHQ